MKTQKSETMEMFTMRFMSDFLAAPFTAMMYANAWLSGMISGRIIIIAMETDDDNEMSK